MWDWWAADTSGSAESVFSQKNIFNWISFFFLISPHLAEIRQDGISLLFTSSSKAPKKVKGKRNVSYSIKVLSFLLSPPLLNKSAHSWDSGSSSQSPFDHVAPVREFGGLWSTGPSSSYYDNWDTSTSDGTNGVRFDWSRAPIAYLTVEVHFFFLRGRHYATLGLRSQQAACRDCQRNQEYAFKLWCLGAM